MAGKGFNSIAALREIGAAAAYTARVMVSLKEVMQDEEMSYAATELMGREREFRSMETAMLAGVAMHKGAREHMLSRVEASYRSASPRLTLLRDQVDEVVIGGGVHAAIYCTVRRALGFPKPIVITKEVGGAFACSKGAAFFLNSRNRPGEIGIPGDVRGALNIFPGSPLQPSDIGSGEFQTNDTLGFITRMLLAFNAEVFIGNVMALDKDRTSGSAIVNVDTEFAVGQRIKARRVIVATGLNFLRDTDNVTGPPRGERIIDFFGFMRRMDEQTFPLRGLRRIAVVGAGDSGKNAIEALIGQGPGQHMSVASLDWPRQIDWYGVPAEQITPEGWANCNRSRYKPIGRLFPTTESRGRVKPRTDKARGISEGFEVVYVNERPYDLVILCTGYKSRKPVCQDEWGIQYDTADRAQRREIARKQERMNVWAVGPCAEIGFSTEESYRSFTSTPENTTALFRYGQRTALLAKAMPSVGAPRF